MRALRIDTEGKTEVIGADLDSIQKGVGTEDLGHASMSANMLETLDVPTNISITIWHDDLAYLRESSPKPNFLATGLYSTGHVILGSVVLQAYNRNSGVTVDLPESVVQELEGPDTAWSRSES